jgi:hypothetical protein
MPVRPELVDYRKDHTIKSRLEMLDKLWKMIYNLSTRVDDTSRHHE